MDNQIEEKSEEELEKERRIYSMVGGAIIGAIVIDVIFLRIDFFVAYASFDFFVWSAVVGALIGAVFGFIWAEMAM